MVQEPFDDYKELYRTNAAGIRASLNAPESNATKLLAVAVELGRDSKRVPQQLHGDLTAAVVGRIVPTERDTAKLARDGILAVAITRDFADEVDVFDGETKKANAEFQRHWAASQAMSHDPDYRDPKYDGPKAETWGQCYAAGNVIYRPAKTALNDAAGDSKYRLAHPDKAPIHSYFKEGQLPLEALALFPGVRLTPQDVRNAMKNARPPALGVPLEVLQTRLDYSRASGITPKTYKTLLQVYWQTKSLERAGINIEDWDLTKGAKALEPIITKVYEYYGNLYKDNPRLEWAGLANLVGPSFAAGFLDLGMMRNVLQKVREHSPGLPLPPPFDKDTVDKLAGMSESEVRWYEQKFLSMQKQIFLDMGSMNQAYVDGGMPAINEMAEAGLFEKSTNPQATQQMLQSWRTIDDPHSTPAQLHEAARLQAYREQHDIIQDDYEDMRNRRYTGEAVTKTFSTVGQVSVPGTKTMGEYDPSSASASVTVDPLGPGKVTTTTTVTIPVPQGNVADFEDRWDYFTKDTLPAYVKLLDDPGSTGTSMDEQLKPSMSGRIDDYRIHHRIDDLAKVFINGTKVDVDVKAGW